MLLVLRTLSVIAASAFCVLAEASQIVIGQLAPLDDPESAGRHVSLGLQTYFSAVNHAGGIHGATIKFVVKDRGQKSAEAASRTRSFLLENEPLALVGLQGTGWMEELVKSRVLEEAGIPVVGIRTGSISLHQPVHPYLFHTRANYLGELQKIVTQLSTTGLGRVAVFYENSTFGEEGLELARRAMQGKPAMQLVRHASYAPRTTDVEDAVKRLHAAAPQSIIAIATSAATAEFYKSFRVHGGKSQVIAISVADGAEVVQRIGKEHARGMIYTHVVPDPVNRATPLVRELHANMKKHGPPGAPINHAVVEGYIAAKTMVEALRIAGPNPTRKKVRAALESMKNYDAGGVIIGFSPANHTGSRHVEMAITLASGRLMR